MKIDFTALRLTKFLFACILIATNFGITILGQEIIPYLQTPDESSIWISWKTGSAAETIVHYGTDSSQLDQTVTGAYQEIEDPDYTGDYFYHSVQVKNLQASTPYYYKAVSGSSESSIHRFKTQPAPGSNDGHYRFLVFGDHQVSNRDGYQRLMRAAEDHVVQKYGGSIEDHINLILNDGDQVDLGNLWQYENIHFGKSEPLSPVLPIMTVVGNHETYGSLGLDAYYPHFFYDKISYKGISSPGGENYYSFQLGRILFVMTSTEHPNQAQVDWVQRIVDSVKVDDQVDWVFSVGHRPIQAEQYVGDISVYIRDRIIPVLTQTEKSVLFIGGHHHLYARGQLRDDPMYHIISGGASWDQYWGQSTEVDFDDVQKTIDYWAYQIVDIDLETNRMDVETYAIGSPKLGFTLDNVLIDTFHRQFGKTAPLKPEITTTFTDTIVLPYAISSSDYQTNSDEELNSTQFQISHNTEFADLAIDLIRDFENLYGTTGDPAYLPIDIHKNVDILEYSIKQYKLANGTYYVRVRHRDKNMEWSEWSDPKSFIVKGSTEGYPELSTERSSYNPGESIEISYKYGPANASDWIGIYNKDAVPGGGESSVDWDYVDGSDGTVTLSVSDPGEYFIGFFANDGYEEISERISIFIMSIPLTESAKEAYNTNEQIVINYSNAPSFSNDWIGIYKQGDIPGIVGSTAWDYVSGENGSVQFDSLTTGNYFANYFILDGYSEPGERTHFSVGASTESAEVPATENTILIYPSPSKGMIHFNLNDLEEDVIAIRATSITGVVVYEQRIKDNQSKNIQTIDFSGQKKGIYIIQLTTTGAIISRKILIV